MASKKSTQEKLSEALGVANTQLVKYDQEPIDVEVISSTTTAIATSTDPNFKQDSIEDYHKAREVILFSMKNNKRAIDSLMALSTEGESARLFEVLGQLLKLNADLAKDLLTVQKTIIEIQKIQLSSEDGKTGQQPVNNGMVINGNVAFTGTTMAALRALKENKKN